MYHLSFVETAEKKYHHYKIQNNKGTEMILFPEYGAAMMQLKLEGNSLVDNIQTAQDGRLTFLNSSCSAVLFPFANRIKDGHYSFNQKDYQLACNEVKLGHALHGLVNKAAFEMDGFKSDQNTAKISFVRTESNPPSGFPFPFTIKLSYILTNTGLRLSVTIQNIGKEAFPFSLGWHPYFYSSKLDDSSIEIKSRQKITNDKRMIPTGVVDSMFPNPLKLKDQTFDNTFLLEDTKVVYKTPDYQMQLDSLGDQQQQYIHFYIPSHRQSIAIEPMTAAADCFNNHIGVKLLAVGKSYTLDWQVELLD